jgi:hypothetical protein
VKLPHNYCLERKLIWVQLVREKRKACEWRELVGNFVWNFVGNFVWNFIGNFVSVLIHVDCRNLKCRSDLLCVFRMCTMYLTYIHILLEVTNKNFWRKSAFHLSQADQGSMLWAQFYAIFTNFMRRKFCVYLKKCYDPLFAGFSSVFESKTTIFFADYFGEFFKS